MVRRLLFAALLQVNCALCALASENAAASGPATESAPSRSRFAHVDVAPTKTSIYVGVVSMTMPTFERKAATYEAPYVATVFPLFFYNEKGRLSVDVTDSQLDRLAQRQTIEFTGRAVRDDGTTRQVTGRATPLDDKSGKLKVRVAISKHIELVFNTTYRFRD